MPDQSRLLVLEWPGTSCLDLWGRIRAGKLPCLLALAQRGVFSKLHDTGEAWPLPAAFSAVRKALGEAEPSAPEPVTPADLDEAVFRLFPELPSTRIWGMCWRSSIRGRTMLWSSCWTLRPDLSLRLCR